MNFTEAKTKRLFTDRYNTANWKDFLKNDLGWDIEFHNPVKRIDLQEHGVVEALEIGYVKASIDVGFVSLLEEKIPVVEIRLTGYEIQRNRAGLKAIARKAYQGTGQREMLVVFYGLDRTEWRFSFMGTEGPLGRHETSAKRFTYIFGTPETHRTAIDRFRRLAGLGKVLSLDKLKDAFSVEKLNDEFFDEYKRHYNTLVAELTVSAWALLCPEPKPTEEKALIAAQKPIRDFAKRFMGRLVFLQFLQKKGWMGCPASTDPAAEWKGGRGDFLQHLFEVAPDKGRFYADYLYPLFFETLNKRRAHDSFEPHGINPCRVPYLNGGLFDANPVLDKRGIPIPGARIGEVLEFFASYNFTIEENRVDDHEVGIDPEMLGHIFENLLEDNRERGTFYTPKLIVQYMCQEALLHYLAGRGLPQGDIAPFVRGGDLPDTLKPEAVRIDELLRAIKVCDPAIGSGAFPMGMLTEILSCRQRLHTLLTGEGPETFPVTEAKKAIIQNSIYGVDIDGGAVDIARLRFWLSLVVDEERPEPLPNLDYKIMQGNSLLESFEGISLKELAPTRVQVVNGQAQGQLFGKTEVQTSLFSTSGSEVKEGAQEEIRTLLANYFQQTDADKKAKTRALIQEKVDAHIEYNLDLSGKQTTRLLDHAEYELAQQPSAGSGRDEGTRKRNAKARERAEAAVEALQAKLQRIRAARKKLTGSVGSTERNYFLWHLFFQDVFQQGGFDVVVGNPPYFSLAGRTQDQTAYQTEGYSTYEKGTDIYCLFYELALQKLKRGGVFSFITSNSWLQTKYGKSLRQLLNEQAQLLALLNFEDTRLFKEATVETNILLCRRDAPPMDGFKTGEDGQDYTLPWQEMQACIIPPSYAGVPTLAEYVAQMGYAMNLLDDEGWAILSAEGFALKTKMEQAGPKLKDWDVRINYGIKTGLNEAFIIDEATRARLIQEDPKSAEIIKPTLRGRDLVRYGYRESGEYMIFTRRGLDIDAYPAIKNHLNSWRDMLEPKREGFENGRKPGQYLWFDIQDNVAYWRDFEKPKIIWGELSNEAKFSFDEQGHFVEATTFFMIGTHLYYLVSVLNSKAAGWFFEVITTTSGVGTNRWKKYKLNQLPIPVPNEMETKIEDIAKQLIGSKQEMKSALLLSQDIDQCLYQLLNLSEDEIALIERWWAARYPKLAVAQLKELEALGPKAAEYLEFARRHWLGQEAVVA